MLEDTRFALDELYEKWHDDPSQIVVEDAMDQLLFHLKSLTHMMVAYERRFDMQEARFNKLEERIASATTEVARWRGEVQTLKKR